MTRRILLELRQARLGFDYRQDFGKRKAVQPLRITLEFRAQHVCGRLKAAVEFEKHPGGSLTVREHRDRVGYDPERPGLRIEFPARTEIVDGDAFAPGASFDRDTDVVDAEKMFKLPGSP